MAALQQMGENDLKELGVPMVSSPSFIYVVHIVLLQARIVDSFGDNSSRVVVDSDTYIIILI